MKWKNFDILIITIAILLGLGAASFILFRIIETLRGFLNFIVGSKMWQRGSLFTRLRFDEKQRNFQRNADFLTARFAI